MNKIKLYIFALNKNHRGPGSVYQNLIKGLSTSLIEIVEDVKRCDIAGCLQHPGMDYNKLPSATVMGPNIFVLPNENPEIWNNFKNYIVPSVWVKDLYQTFNLNNKNQLNVWPVGIDTKYWSPNNNIKKELDCFIYYKNRTKNELIEVVKICKKLSLKLKIIEYGNYQEKDLLDLCNQSKFCIILSGCESQGCAQEQIMSMNIPCFVVNKNIWNYQTKNESFVTTCSATSVPYFDVSCGFIKNDDNFLFIDELKQFINQLNNNKFSPRLYIEKNLNLELQSQSYIDILMKSFGHINE